MKFKTRNAQFCLELDKREPGAEAVEAILAKAWLGEAEIRHYPPDEDNGIIVLRMPDASVAQTFVNLLERFLKQKALAAQTPG